MLFNPGDIVLRLAVAAFCGAVIGTERSLRNHPAGARTFSLVCLGAAIAMILGDYLVSVYQSGDPARLAAQVISGVGFLGVGTIIVTGHNSVKGLSTAAELWVTACLGIVFGSGNFFLGLAAFAIVVIIMTALSYLSHYIDNHTRVLILTIEGSCESLAADIKSFASDYGYSIQSMERLSRAPLFDKDAVITVKLNLNSRKNHSLVIDELTGCINIHHIEESR